MQRNSHITFSAGHKFRRFSFALCCSGPIACLLVLMALLLTAHRSFAVAPRPASVPFHFVRGFAVVVPVSVNGQGPYDFMLDTGSTITTLDNRLGQELGLAAQGMGTVTTLTQSAPAPLAIASRVAIGPVTEENLVVMIRDLNGLHQIAPTARGVLGQNALDHTDFLLDYKHKLIQFDIDGELGRSLGGRHVPLHREPVGNNSKYANLSVHGSVNDNGVREMELLLDSGSASLVLFAGVDSVGSGYTTSFVADTAGHHLLAGIRDLQLVIDGKSREVPTHVLSMKGGGRPNIGGLLPTSIFNRIYISNSGGFAMFEPKQLKSSALSGAVASFPSQGTAAHRGGF
jgi:Aspartyl protease